MSEGSYNAVTWLLDRNVEDGRGGKLAFDDTVSRLTYGELQRETRRAANMLRRLGVRREERVAMIMLDTVDFPIVFLGAIRAGIVPVPLNTLLTVGSIRLHPRRLPRARAVRLRSALSRHQGRRRPHAGSRACRGLRRQA